MEFTVGKPTLVIYLLQYIVIEPLSMGSAFRKVPFIHIFLSNDLSILDLSVCKHPFGVVVPRLECGFACSLTFRKLPLEYKFVAHYDAVSLGLVSRCLAVEDLRRQHIRANSFRLTLL